MKKSTPFRSLSSFVAGLAALLTLAAHPASGVTKTWVGTTADWGTADNWSPSGVATNTDDALFTSTGAGSVYLGTAARSINSITNDSTTAATPYTIYLRESEAVSTARKLTVGTNGITVAAGSHTIRGVPNGSGGAAEIGLTSGSSFNVAAASSLTFWAKLGGGSGSSKTGAGTLVLKADNGGTSPWTHTGFTVSEGTLELANNRATGKTDNKYIVSSGATLKLSASGAWGATAGTLTLDGIGVSGVGALYATATTTNGGAAVNLAGNSRIGVDAAQVLTISAPITNTFALEKSGLGTLSLSGALSYSGATTISAGKLTFSTAGSATSDVTVAGAATNGVLVASAGGQWVNTGSLTNQNNSVVEVNYGSILPSTTTAPIKVNNFSAGTGLTLKVVGVGFSAGQDYPLVTWTGSGPANTNGFANLDLPTSPAVSGYLTVSNKTLSLRVTTGQALILSWNTGNGDWDTTTTNWVNTASNLSTNYTDPTDVVLFNDAAGASGNPTVNLASAFSPVSVTMKSTNHDYTISGLGGIGGSASLILPSANTRTLTLATANSYNGGTFISGGTVALSGSGTLGSAAGVLFLSGGRLDLGGLTSANNGAVSITAAAASGETITNGTLSATSYAASNPSGDAIISAILDGSGTFTKSGAGTVTLAGPNSYSGVTTVSAGVLNLTGNRTADAGFITVGSEGTAAALNISDGNFTIPTKMFVGVGASSAGNGTVNHTAGAVTFGTSNDQLLLGTGIGSGTYNLSGGSLTTLARTSRGVMLGVNTGSSGTFNLSGTGSLSMAATSQLQIGRSDSAGVHNTTNLFSQTGGTASVGILRIGGASTTGSTNITATMTLTGGTFAATTFDRLAQGNNNTNTITIGGTADVTLPAFPTARGANATATLSFDGGTLRPLTDSATYMGGLTSAKIKAGGATVNVDSGKNITITQALLTDDVSTNGGLTKAGDGVLVLSGTNTYTGGTAVNAGELKFSTAGSATTPITVAGSATNGVLVATAGGQWVNTGNLTNQNGSALEVNYGSTLPGTTTAPIKVNNYSVGTGLTLKVVGVGFTAGQDYPLVTWTGSGPANTNAFTTLDLPALTGYLTVSGNTLYLHVTAVLYLSWNTGDGDWDTTTQNWVDSALNPTNYTDLADVVLFNDASGVGVGVNPVVNLASAYSPVGVYMKSTSHDYTVSGTGGIGGSGPVILDAANTRTLTLATTSSYTGGTVVGGGTLQIGGAGNLGNGAYAGAIAIGSGATLRYSSSADQTFSSVISGAGSFVKDTVTNNTLTLSGANTFSGGITVSAGRITVSSAAPLSTNAITLVGDASVGGQLLASGAMTISNNFVISGVGYPDTGGRAGAIRPSNGAIFTGKITLAGDSRIGPIASGTITNTVNGQITGLYAMDFCLGMNGNNVTSIIGLANTGTPNDFTGNASISCVDYSTARTGGKTILQLGANEQIPNGAGKGSLVFNGADANHITTLELNGFNETLNGITNVAAVGAIIQNTATGASVLTVGDAATTSTFSGLIADGGTGKTLAITKVGTGVLTLTGTNSYTGNTTVSNGTLVIAVASIATNSTVSVSSGAFLQLTFASTNRVGALVLGGVTKAGGVYNSTTGAPFITGAGSLEVVATGPSGPATLTNSVSGGMLSLAWPAGQGWRLQLQTNSLSVGLFTNWTYITDGTLSSTNITMDKTKPTVFYRLVYP